MTKDPYRYFRIEARELLEALTLGVLALERGTGSAEVIARLLRVAHTLKGAARVVRRPGIAEQAHQIEGVLGAITDPTDPLGAARSAALLRALDQIAAEVGALDAAPAAPATATAPPAADAPRAAAAGDTAPETVRVEIGELDALLRELTEGELELGGMRRDLDGLGRVAELARALSDQLAAHRRPACEDAARESVRAVAEELQLTLARAQRGLTESLARADAALAQAGALGQQLRLVPAHTIVAALERAMRDAADAVGRRVELVATGGDVRLDADVLSEVRDALLHMVRNAVTHGIEPEAVRRAAGKPPTGTIAIEVSRQGRSVSFRCHDDGRGIDVEAVRAAAVAAGRVTAGVAAGLDADAVIGLLLAGAAGLSTSVELTELAGRGIGVDVARATAARLGGGLSLRSQPGRGTTVRLAVPVSISAVSALIVDAAGATVAIPLAAVRETRRVADADLGRAEHRDSLVYDGEVIPFVVLSQLLHAAVPPGRRRAWSVVIVRADGRHAAFGVDRLVGPAQLVMRPLSPAVGAEPSVAGAALDRDGRPLLVLDPDALVAGAERQGLHRSDDLPAAPAPILVIDDSLTTRMLEQSILEAAGYRVELAVSAEDGLAKARAGRHGLFLVDVEMPGMDGFEFVALTRADPVLRAVPAILVTSRDAPEDRRRGELAGASAYLIKSEFDQGRLLRMIRTLVT